MDRAISGTCETLVADQDAEGHKKSCCPTRLLIVILTMVGGVFMYAQRMNMSVAIVAMLNGTAVKELHGISVTDVNTSMPFLLDEEAIDGIPLHEQGRFVWSQSTQGTILGAYYYGYAVTQPFTGSVAAKLDPVRLVSVGMLLSTILTFLTPVAADIHVGCLIAARALIGVCHGPFFTCFYMMYTKWTAKTERATAIAAMMLGGNMGACLVMPVTAYLCEHGFLQGYDSSFYVVGAAALVWLICWQFYATSDPRDHKRISGAELDFLKSNTDSSSAANKPKSCPWGKVFTSPAVWACIAGRGLGAFGYMVICTKLPAYLEVVLDVPIHRNGIINSALYLAICVSLLMAGPLSDFIYKKHWLSLTTIRKIFQAISMIVPAICLILVPLVGKHENAVFALLILAMWGYGFNSGGENPVIGEFAPDYAGYIYGVVNTFLGLMGFVTPLVAGLLLGAGAGHDNWSLVFYISSALFVIGCIFFCIFGTTDLQPWAIHKPTVDEEESQYENNIGNFANGSLKESSKSQIGMKIVNNNDVANS